jgi:hypothetical protein
MMHFEHQSQFYDNQVGHVSELLNLSWTVNKLDECSSRIGRVNQREALAYCDWRTLEQSASDARPIGIQWKKYLFKKKPLIKELCTLHADAEQL